MPAEIEINTIAQTFDDSYQVDSGVLRQFAAKFPAAIRTATVPGLVRQVISRAGQKKISVLRIYGHAVAGQQMVGGGYGGAKDDHISDDISNIMLRRGVINCRSELAMLGRWFTPLSVVELHGCETGLGTEGMALCRALARLWGITVCAGYEKQRATADLVFVGRYIRVFPDGEVRVGSATQNGPFTLIGNPNAGPADDELEPWPVLGPGTMLSKVADARYGNMLLWPLIWDYNRKVVGENPNRVPSNVTLRVRKQEKYSGAEIANARSRSGTWRNYPT